MSEKFKGSGGNSELLTAFLVVVVGLAAFGLGRMSVEEKPVFEPETRVSAAVTLVETEVADVESYVASKKGTKYHLPWCPGAQQMSETNKIYFDSKKAAEEAGYTPAANCKGI